MLAGSSALISSELFLVDSALMIEHDWLSILDLLPLKPSCDKPDNIVLSSGRTVAKGQSLVVFFALLLGRLGR